mmetsp:Transcript_28767/g.95546  ORF Transcript_28767/g.95546 Transcript_28767/m.95546 type:complete len:347 (-) Transcript_28767:765-1805(-)
MSTRLGLAAAPLRRALGRRRHAHGGTNLLDHLAVQIRGQEDGPVSHLLDERVRARKLLLRVEPLNHQREHVAYSDGLLAVRLAEQRVAATDHLVWVGLDHLPRRHEPRHVCNLGLQRRHAGRPVRRVPGLPHVRESLVECTCGLLVVPVLVNLNLRAHVVEGGERLERLALVVKRDDVLQDLGVRVPVQVLQVVCGEDVDLARARYTGKEDNLVGVPRLEQAAHPLDLVARLRVLLARQVVVALALAALGDLQQERLARALRLRTALPELGAEPLSELLRYGHVVHRAQLDRALRLAGNAEEAHRLVKLAVLEEEISYLAEERRIGVGGEVVRNLAKRLKLVVLEA